MGAACGHGDAGLLGHGAGPLAITLNVKNSLNHYSGFSNYNSQRVEAKIDQGISLISFLILQKAPSVGATHIPAGKFAISTLRKSCSFPTY